MKCHECVPWCFRSEVEDEDDRVLAFFSRVVEESAQLVKKQSILGLSVVVL